MSFCSSCGKEIPEDSNLCPYCGKVIKSNLLAQQQQPVNTSVQLSQEQKNSQQSYGSNNGAGVASMVLGICALVFFCVPVLPIALGIIGLVLGVSGMKKTNASRGMAVAGLVMSIVSLGLGVLPLIGVVSCGATSCGAISCASLGA